LLGFITTASDDVDFDVPLNSSSMQWLLRSALRYIFIIAIESSGRLSHCMKMIGLKGRRESYPDAWIAFR